MSSTSQDRAQNSVLNDPRAFRLFFFATLGSFVVLKARCSSSSDAMLSPGRFSDRTIDVGFGLFKESFAVALLTLFLQVHCSQFIVMSRPPSRSHSKHHVCTGDETEKCVQQRVCLFIRVGLPLP